MNYNLIAKQICVSLFAIFLGSQITEGFLLVPYWQSLAADEFYNYYAKFGPTIGRFYTILTIVAALIPITIALKYLIKKYEETRYAVLSAILALLVILSFYVYFKTANEHFYNRTFDELGLKKELVIWSYWHWSRIVLEILSLSFLIMVFGQPVVKESSGD